MSSMKILLESIIDFELVEEILVEDGLNVEEMVKLYDNAGGDETYEMWGTIYGYELINNWLNNYKGTATTEYELVTEGVIFVFKNYIKWLKSFN